MAVTPDRFVDLFAQEARLRLDRLASGLLTLESSPDRGPVVAALLREMHTFKGEAAVVGLKGVSAVAHALETAVEPMRGGTNAPPPELVDNLLAAVDGLREVVTNLGHGTDDGRIDALLAQLGAAEASSSPAPSTPPASTPMPPAPVQPDAAPSGSELIELPAERIDEIVRSVSESAAAHQRLGHRIGERVGEDPEGWSEFRDLRRSIRDVQEQAVRARMVPVATVTARLQRAARDVARASGKQVTWTVEGDETELDRSVLQQLADPLLHMVRNAVDHGIEPPEERVAAGKSAAGTVFLAVAQEGSDVTITLRDDGRGLDIESLRREAARHGLSPDLSDAELRDVIFVGGMSTAASVSETSGRGVGLDVVRAKVESLRGRVDVRSAAGRGTEFRIVVPSAATVMPCLIVSAGQSRLALPMSAVASTQGPTTSTAVQTQGRPAVWVGNTVMPLASLAEVLGLPSPDDGPLVVVVDEGRSAAFQVGSILGQRDIVVKGLGPFVPRLPAVAGAAVEGDGAILIVLGVHALLAAVAQPGRASVEGHPGTVESDRRPTDRATSHGTILVADDALAVRELERSILEQAGYAVVTASDGAEALAQLTSEPVDLVLTDIDMPGMNGFDLTRAIRQHPTLHRTPVLIVSSNNTPEHHRAGLEAGADGYIVKSAFGEDELLATVERLLGHAA